MTISATFTTSTDEDWFKAQLNAGITYKVVLATEVDISLLSLNAYSADDYDLLDFNGDLSTAGRGENGGGNSDGSTQLVFTPLLDSTYYIQALQFDQELNPVTYSITIEEVADDFADNSDTTGVVSIGGNVQGVIEEKTDEDWFKVQLQAGISYQFVLDYDGDEAPYLNAYSVEDTAQTIFSSNGSRGEQGSHFSGRSSNSMVFTPSTSSTYYVEVDSSYTDTGSYSLTLDSIQDDYPDNTDTSGSLSVGSTLTGTINAKDDADFIKMELAAGNTYHISSPVAATSGLSLQLSSWEDGQGLGISGGDQFRYDLGSINIEATGGITVSPLKGGTYFLQVEESSFSSFTDDSANGFTPIDYSINLQAVTDDYVDTIATTGVVSVGGAQNGLIEVENDKDWFSSELEGGVTYRVRVDGVGGSARSLEDILAEITELTEQIGSGELSPEEVLALQDTLLALIDEQSSLGTNTAFSLEARSDEDFDPYENTVGRSEQVSVGPIGEDFSQLVFTPRQSGTYYFDVSHSGTRTGEYTVTLDVITDDYADTSDSTGSISVGSSASGKVDDFGDADWFSTELDANITYLVRLTTEQQFDAFTIPFTLNVSSTDDGVGLSGFGIYDPDNTGADYDFRYEYAFYQQSGTSHVAFTPFEGGTYYIEVGGLFSDSVNYNLTLETIADDYPDHAGTSGTISSSGNSAPQIPDPDDVDTYFVGTAALYQSAIREDDGDIISTESAQIFRLYMGGLGRIPDEGGFYWWQGNVDDGSFSLAEVADRFVDSEEFKEIADSNSDSLISNEEFMTHMYLNVFGREPDADGLAWWLEQLSSDEYSQGTAFSGMVQSDEYVEQTVQTVSEWDLWI